MISLPLITLLRLSVGAFVKELFSELCYHWNGPSRKIFLNQKIPEKGVADFGASPHIWALRTWGESHPHAAALVERSESWQKWSPLWAIKGDGFLCLKILRKLVHMTQVIVVSAAWLHGTASLGKTAFFSRLCSPLFPGAALPWRRCCLFVAQLFEAEGISERTREALATVKELGRPKTSPKKKLLVLSGKKVRTKDTLMDRQFWHS